MVKDGGEYSLSVTCSKSNVQHNLLLVLEESLLDRSQSQDISQTISEDAHLDYGNFSLAIGVDLTQAGMAWRSPDAQSMIFPLLCASNFWTHHESACFARRHCGSRWHWSGAAHVSTI